MILDTPFYEPCVTSKSQHAKRNMNSHPKKNIPFISYKKEIIINHFI